MAKRELIEVDGRRVEVVRRTAPRQDAPRSASLDAAAYERLRAWAERGPDSEVERREAAEMRRRFDDEHRSQFARVDEALATCERLRQKYLEH